ncbi:hypothetical protein AB0M22_09070 [Nocardia sp. NPDC051756]|uniref:hypothetical protein n=1 Tax=Nocardia sp. NPDC051756 TaxID=3154751 RepID=UPI00343BC0E9
MPLFGGGRAPKYVRLGTAQVTHVILGEEVVFDGTTPAVVTLPRATATAGAHVPDVKSGAAVVLPTATAVCEARTPTITAGGAVAMPSATAAAAAVAPQMSAGATIELPTAEATGSAVPPFVQVVVAGEVLLPRAEATATALLPSVAVIAQVALPVATAVGEALLPTVVSGAGVTLPAPSAAAAALVPTFTAGAAITLPRAQASAAALLPVIGGGGSITLPTAAATAAALVPAVSAGAYFTDDFNRANNTSLGANWTETGGDLGIISNQLAVQGTTASRRAAIYNSQTVTPYQSVEFTVGSAPNGTAVAGAVLRCNAAMTEMVLFGVYNGGWQLGRITGINGTYTAIGSGTVTVSSGNTARVQVDENNVYSVYLNGVKNGSSYRDTTWGDSSHRYLGLYVQRVSTTNSHSLDNFVGKDVTPYSLFASDDFTRASLGASWTTRFGPLYIASNELSAVGNASEPISYGWHVNASSTDDQACEARIRWHSRAPLHSSVSVCVRADPASSHGGVHYWRVADKHGICMYSWDGTTFTSATGLADIISTTAAPEGSKIRIEARGTVYTAFLDNVPVLQGTFTTGQVPLTNHYCGVHGEDDSAVSGGGDPPANLDDWAAYAIL